MLKEKLQVTELIYPSCLDFGIACNHSNDNHYDCLSEHRFKGFSRTKRQATFGPFPVLPGGHECEGPKYGSSVWDPHTHGLQEELEKVQNRAARFVTGNYVFETGSMTGILGQLKWESLNKRRKDSTLILLYKGLKGKARIPTDDLIPNNRRCRNQHALAFQIPSASKEAYKSSFFPQTVSDWNDLPDSLISSAEMSDDCVSKFASLVRSRN